VDDRSEQASTIGPGRSGGERQTKSRAKASSGEVRGSGSSATSSSRKRRPERQAPQRRTGGEPAADRDSPAGSSEARSGRGSAKAGSRAPKSAADSPGRTTNPKSGASSRPARGPAAPSKRTPRRTAKTRERIVSQTEPPEPREPASVDESVPQLAVGADDRIAERVAVADLAELLAEVRDLVVRTSRLPDARTTSDLAVAALVQQQQAMVVRLDQTARRAQNVDVLRHLVRQFLREVRVRAVETVESVEFFPGATSDGAWVVTDPAYVDVQSGRLVQPGRAVQTSSREPGSEERDR